jgi:Mg2+/Co2+ transporter CorB
VIGLRYFGDTGLALAPIILTVFFLIFAEVAPKTVAAKRPESIAFPSAFILEPLLKILRPGVVFVNAIANFIVKPFIAHSDQSSEQLSVDELRTIVSEGVGISTDRQNMMLGILDLEKVTVDDIMVPRSEIVGIDIDNEHSEIVDQVLNSQHTRVPIYRQNENNIIGLLHLRRASRFLMKEDFSKADVLEETEEPYFVPEGTPLHTQLFNFQKERSRIGLVVDEYGDIQGIVTLEDILEEIVGEFTTDYASDMPEIHPQDDGSYFIQGMAVLRDINRALSWSLPTNGPRTLNGLVLEHLEFIPETNVCLQIGSYLIETLQITDNVVRSVKIQQLIADEEESADENIAPPSDNEHDGLR